jgi:hypothetical protein
MSNSIWGNTISTAVYAGHSKRHSKAAARFVSFHLISIPKYWEEPEPAAWFGTEEA